MADLKRRLDWSCTDLMTAARHFTTDTMKSRAQALAEKVRNTDIWNVECLEDYQSSFSTLVVESTTSVKKEDYTSTC